jgi:hypothetical protein
LDVSAIKGRVPRIDADNVSEKALKIVAWHLLRGHPCMAEHIALAVAL